MQPGMVVGQPQGGYPAAAHAQANGRPAVPARAGGIPVLPTAVVRGMRGAEPARPAPAPAAPAPRAVSAVVAIPSPEELGLGSAPAPAAPREARPAALDWTATRRDLAEVGAVRFQMETLPSGGSRFSCWLRDGSSLRPVQGDGPSEAEAVRLCLARARTPQP